MVEQNVDNFDANAWAWLKENQLSYNIWDKKYRYNNESFEAWLDRVSSNNAEIKRLIFEKKFLFGGRTLSNRNTGKGSYSNCYSIGYVPDSLDGIMDVNTKIAMTFKAQGGQGLSLSKIRPKGSLIHNEFKSDGIVPFMEIFNTTTNSVSQGGSRKGALLMSLDINHPEAETFMTIKSDHNKINKANLSMEIDNEFMLKVKEGDKESNRLFRILCEQACKHAEPGVIFTNRFRNYNLMQYVDDYQIETCNPCGEQPLPKNGACNLSSINLSEYIENPFTNEAKIDYSNLIKDINIIVKAMDDVLEENLNNHPLQEQKDMAQNYRNIGIGVMGLHDMFIKLGLIYGSEDSKKALKTLITTIFKSSLLGSLENARIKGTFPKYNSRIWDADIIKNNLDFGGEIDTYIDIYKEIGLRNCSLLSIAPTGSIGTMFNVSTGVEPFFALKYKRRTVSLDGKETIYDVDVPVIEEAKKRNWHPECYVTANDINPFDRIDIQSILQDSVDTAISSTINLPKSTTPEDIYKIYLYAWEKGLKGITVYVDGCRDSILATSFNPKTIITSNAPKRPKELDADYYQVKVKGEQFIVLVGLYENKPYEIFTFRPTEEMSTKIAEHSNELNKHRGKLIKVGKMHYKFDSDLICITDIQLANDRIEEKAATLYASMLLRHGVDIEQIIKIARKVNTNISSFSSAMCRILYKYVPIKDTGEKCPECGGKIIREGGCEHCENGDWSRCS